MNKKNKQAFLSGIIFVLLFSISASYLSEITWIKALKISPLILGIILGMIYANTLRSQLPAEWNPGIGFCSKQILRFGIVLYGFQISFNDVMSVGAAALVIDGVVVTLTLILGVLVGRLMGMDKQTALLTSVGSSICGAAAVLAAEPVVKGPAYKTTVAVSTVVIFGTIAMFLYPACYRAGLFDMNVQQLGLFTGATLHEVAHVYGAGEAMNTSGPFVDMIQSGAVDIQREAVIVKMIRVIMLAPVLLVLGLILSRSSQEDGSGKRTRVSVPLFAIMFVVVIAFNSLNILPVELVNILKLTASFLLTMAMTALGLNTSIAQFKQAGWKPFILAAVLFLWLFFGGYYLVKLVTSLFATIV